MVVIKMKGTIKRVRISYYTHHAYKYYGYKAPWDLSMSPLFFFTAGDRLLFLLRGFQ